MNGTTEHLVREFKTVIRNAEDLIKATAGDSTDATREKRARLAGAVLVARETCQRLEEQGRNRWRAASRQWEENALWFLFAGFAAGTLLGYLAPELRRRLRSK